MQKNRNAPERDKTKPKDVPEVGRLKSRKSALNKLINNLEKKPNSTNTYKSIDKGESK